MNLLGLPTVDEDSKSAVKNGAKRFIVSWRTTQNLKGSLLSH